MRRALPDYLWGIETLHRKNAPGSKPALPDYLWGIETFFLFCLFLSFETASRLPMRNWNTETSSRLHYNTLPDYLWGIETSSSFLTRRVLPVASRLPMRNWNPHQGIVNFPAMAELPDYLWGIETCEFFEIISMPDFASRLPMRNWNAVGSMRYSKALTASRLPMRNWNCRWPRCNSRFHPASRLPMRNWNNAVGISNEAVSAASRLPMRNWNHCISILSRCSRRFQTTYEELKQRGRNFKRSSLCASRLPMRNWNIFQSHSRLFLRWASRLPMRNWNQSNSSRYRHRNRFQTTYEELKPLCTSARFSVLLASRLPMRNWNSSCRSGWHARLLMASRLPMRNWNSGRAPCGPPSSASLPDYLWGIETNLQFLWRQLKVRFQTTYEELKLRQPSDHCYHPAASRLPMRNWNGGSFEGRCFFTLPDYLWGIETPDFCSILVWKFFRFQTTYEELKQKLLQQEADRRVASRLPMRNWNLPMT